MTGRRIILGILLTVLVCTQASAASTPLIVQLSPSASLNTVLSLLQGVLVDVIPGANIYLIQVPSIPVLSPLLSLAGVQWMEVNQGVVLPPMGQLGVVQAGMLTPADWYKNQPALLQVRSQSGLAYATGTGVVVADINSQVDFAHPALIGHMTSGYDFIAAKPANETALNQSSSGFLDQSSSGFLDQSTSGFLEQSSSGFLDGFPLLGANPAYSHGTLCAGLIAQVAPDAMIMPLRAFDENGSADLFMLAKAIRYAVSHGAQVINMSFGTTVDSKAVRAAIDYAIAQNAVLIASAGNANSSALQYPAAYNDVTAVAAIDLQNQKGSFSNYGSYVALSAPGVNVISAYPNGFYSVVSGTSFSAPIVAGTAALVRSQHATGVTLSITNGSINIDSANPGYAGLLGSGRVDVVNAVHP